MIITQCLPLPTVKFQKSPAVPLSACLAKPITGTKLWKFCHEKYGLLGLSAVLHLVLAVSKWLTHMKTLSIHTVWAFFQHQQKLLLSTGICSVLACAFPASSGWRENASGTPWPKLWLRYPILFTCPAAKLFSVFFFFSLQILGLWGLLHQLQGCCYLAKGSTKLSF